MPTIVVAAACAVMIALGIWQLQRAQQRDAQALTHAQNSRNPELVAFPELPPVAPEMLYRRSSVVCLEVTGWQESGGTAASGARGFRHIASCRTGAEGPGALVDMGVSADPAGPPAWSGGTVTGRITLAPQEAGMISRLLRLVPPAPPLLVSEQPAPGLMTSAAPDPTTQGNSSWAYAFQWFLFAVAAAVIYVLALKRNRASAAAAQSPHPSAQSRGDGGGDSGLGCTQHSDRAIGDDRDGAASAGDSGRGDVSSVGDSDGGGSDGGGGD